MAEPHGPAARNPQYSAHSAQAVQSVQAGRQYHWSTVGRGFFNLHEYATEAEAQAKTDELNAPTLPPPTKPDPLEEMLDHGQFAAAMADTTARSVGPIEEMLNRPHTPPTAWCVLAAWPLDKQSAYADTLGGATHTPDTHTPEWIPVDEYRRLAAKETPTDPDEAAWLRERVQPVHVPDPPMPTNPSPEKDWTVEYNEAEQACRYTVTEKFHDYTVTLSAPTLAGL